MRERTGKHHLTWISGLVIFSLIGGMMLLYPPEQIFIEMIVVSLIWIGVWLTALPFTGRKTAILIATGIAVVLVMNRLGILEPLTLLLLVVILVGVGSV